MVIFRKQFACTLIVALLASVISGYIGYRAGVIVAIQDSFYANKIHAEQELSALNNFHASKPDLVRSNLETALGFSAIMIGERAQLMTDETQARVTKTLTKIKNYRRANPYPDEEKEYRHKIENALEWVPQE